MGQPLNFIGCRLGSFPKATKIQSLYGIVEITQNQLDILWELAFKLRQNDNQCIPFHHLYKTSPDQHPPVLILL